MDVSKHLDAVLQRWDAYFRENPLSLGMTLNKEDFNHMELLNKNIKDMMEQIRTQEFLSPENLDAYHRELMEKVEREKENALNEMKAFMAHNPKKLLEKIADSFGNARDRIVRAEDDGYNGKYLRKANLSLILGTMDGGMKYLNHLMDQVENVGKAKK